MLNLIHTLHIAVYALHIINITKNTCFNGNQTYEIFSKYISPFKLQKVLITLQRTRHGL